MEIFCILVNQVYQVYRVYQVYQVYQLCHDLRAKLKTLVKVLHNRNTHIGCPWS